MSVTDLMERRVEALEELVVELRRLAEGQDLRDRFAGQALTGFVARTPWSGVAFDPEASAVEAYRAADAMLAAREKKP